MIHVKFHDSLHCLFSEYAYSLRATDKSDVYSMGIVLMEVVSGLMPTDRKFGEDTDMVRWVESHINVPSSAQELLDPLLKPLAPDEESSMFEVLDVALQCTRAAPAERPSARQVSDLLLHISMAYDKLYATKKVVEFR